MLNFKKTCRTMILVPCFLLNTAFAVEQCYWMSNLDPKSPWVAAPQGNVDKKTCFNLDSCNGGLAQSNGGCYKWATAPNAERIAWDNVATNTIAPTTAVTPPPAIVKIAEPIKKPAPQVELIAPPQLSCLMDFSEGTMCQEGPCGNKGSCCENWPDNKMCKPAQAAVVPAPAPVQTSGLEVVNSIKTQGMKNVRLTPNQILCSPNGMFALEFTADNSMQLKSAYGNKYTWLPKMDGAKNPNGLNGPSGCLLLQRDGNIGMYSSCDPTGGNANGSWVWSLDRQSGIGKVDYSRFKEKEYWELMLDNNGKLSIFDRCDSPTPEFIISPEVDVSQFADQVTKPLAECGVNGLPPTQVTAEDIIDTNVVDSAQAVSAETTPAPDVQQDAIDELSVDPAYVFE